MKHVAGNVVSPDGDRVIQRCMLCGFALVDMRCSETMVAGGVPATVASFEFGAIVEVVGVNPVQLAVIAQTDHRDNILEWNGRGLCTDG